jgi:hypothetical protein
MVPEEKVGSWFRILTLSEAEKAGVELVVTPIVTECPAQMVEAGEYNPALVIGPVLLFPSVNPFTDQTTAESGTPFTMALYCALPPSLTSVGPEMETWPQD